MDYDEDPEPPNRACDEWIEMYKKEAARLQELRSQVKELPVLLVKHFPKDVTEKDDCNSWYTCSCGEKFGGHGTKDQSVWAKHLWDELFKKAEPAPKSCPACEEYALGCAGVRIESKHTCGRRD